jgi:hypothetical protein
LETAVETALIVAILLAVLLGLIVLVLPVACAVLAGSLPSLSHRELRLEADLRQLRKDLDEVDNTLAETLSAGVGEPPTPPTPAPSTSTNHTARLASGRGPGDYPAAMVHAFVIRLPAEHGLKELPAPP